MALSPELPVPILKKEYVEMIPEFHGEPELLSRFLEIREKLVTKFLNITDPNDFQNECLQSSILAKIKGPAATIVHNSRFSTFNDLKTILINAYSDKRDELTLTAKLVDLKQVGGHTHRFLSKDTKDFKPTIKLFQKP